MLALLLALGAPVTGQAQSAGQWRGPEHIWAASCGYCHDTNVGPQLKGRNLPAEAIAYFVRFGGSAMPAFHPSELNERELTVLSAWLAKSIKPEPKK